MSDNATLKPKSGGFGNSIINKTAKYVPDREVFEEYYHATEGHKAELCEFLILNNMRLVVAVINKNFTVPLICKQWRVTEDDVFSEGYFGLLKAIQTFNPFHIGKDGRCMRFSTYAARCIDNQIRMMYRYHSPNKIGRISLNESVGHPSLSPEDGLCLIDTLEDENGNASEERHGEMQEAREICELAVEIASTTKRRKVMELTLEGVLKQHEIADAVGLSQSYVSRVVKSTLIKAKETYDLNQRQY